MPKLIAFDQEKFKELLLYIADQCKNDRYWGAVKLNKILFYSDFHAFYDRKKPITGADYFAREEGPAPRALVPIREQMRKNGDIGIDKSVQHRVVPLRKANLKIFDGEEIAIVNNVIQYFRDKDADRTTYISHGFLGWKAAMAKSTKTKHVSIPYESVYFDNPPLDEFEEAYGLRLYEKSKALVPGSISGN